MLTYSLSACYHFLNVLRRRFYSQLISPVSSGIPTISVGAFSAGGSGKSPFSVYLAVLLSRAGLKVAIVSHSYRSRLRDARVVSYETQGAPDEARLQAFLLRNEKNVDVIAGRNKKDALAFVRNGAWDVCVLDDALTSFYIERQVDVVLISEGEFFVKRGKLVPARVMRMLPGGEDEGAIKVLRRCEYIKEHFSGDVFVAEEKHVFYTWDLEKIGYEPNLEGKRSVCFAGIARPRRFFSDMEKYFKPVENLPLKDHRRIPQWMLERLASLAEKKDALLITTLKDRIKIPESDLSPFLKERCLVVDLELKVKEEEKFMNSIKKRLRDANLDF